jgi:hypothetical protein
MKGKTMNKTPRIILDKDAREEAESAARARRREAAVRPVLDLAGQIDALSTTIRKLHPDIDLPAYDITEISPAPRHD